MAKLLSQKRARRLLEKNGWVKTVGGKHNIKMEKPGERPITLPMHHGEDYSRSLTAAILEQAGVELMAQLKFNVLVTEEDDGTFWAAVEQLPGCFASGRDFDELTDALSEAIQMCLPDDVKLGRLVSVNAKDETRELVYA